MKAYVFPGQGAQFVGMGKDLYERNPRARELFEAANAILGFDITSVMFAGTDEGLKQTNVTQPAIFLHSVILAATLPDFAPDMVAGHSVGEFSALAAIGVLSFEDGLKLISVRAQAMQAVCTATPSTMAAVLGLPDATIEKICAEITDDVVVPANYNSTGQLVISGTLTGIDLVAPKLLEAGAKRVLKLNVGGAFHSPLMQPAKEQLATFIDATEFKKPRCPIYQNTDAKPHTNPVEIKQNLIAQLTAPVRWTQTVEQMLADGATEFVELGPGNVLCGLIKRTNKDALTSGIQ
jgi:[acyl-carrier-protein] S-malonyltransferase